MITYLPFLPITLQIDSSLQYRLASDCAAMLHTRTTNLSFYYSITFINCDITSGSPDSLFPCRYVHLSESQGQQDLSQPVTVMGGQDHLSLEQPPSPILLQDPAPYSSLVFAVFFSFLMKPPLELSLSSCLKCFPHTCPPL